MTNPQKKRGAEPVDAPDPSNDPVPDPQRKDGEPVDAPDPFNPASLRLSQDPLAATGVKKALIRVPVRRPGPQEYVRVHPGEAYRLDTAIIDLRDDRETYLVAPELRAELFMPKSGRCGCSRRSRGRVWWRSGPASFQASTDGRMPGTIRRSGPPSWR